MAMGKRTSKQAQMFVAATELPVSPGHPFYAKLNTILDGAGSIALPRSSVSASTRR
jgi:transposase